MTSDWNYEIMSASGKHSQKLEIYAPKDVAIAYINLSIFSGDNGRVLGYDNSHGFSHRHYMGKVSPDEFIGYEALYIRFELE